MCAPQPSDGPVNVASQNQVGNDDGDERHLQGFGWMLDLIADPLLRAGLVFTGKRHIDIQPLCR